MKFVLTLLIVLLCSGYIVDRSGFETLESLESVELIEEVEIFYEFSDEERCMALNIYHESRNENLAGQYAVADVVLNRVQDDRWPGSVCGVIYDAEMKPSMADPTILIPKRHRCQFSWYCDGMSDEPRNIDAWNASLTVAYQIMNNETFRGITEGATHYHATYVNPQWNRRFHQIGRIGTHIFYRAD